MCKSIKYVYWVKKDLFGLVWKVWLYRRHQKSNQLIKITMTKTTVLHSRAAPSLKYLPFNFTFCACITFLSGAFRSLLAPNSWSLQWMKRLQMELPMAFGAIWFECDFQTCTKSIKRALLLVAKPVKIYI